MRLTRRPGAGWIVLIGGGEFSFGETVLADRAWLDVSKPGAVGFLPTASGSTEYGGHFSQYLHEAFDRDVETIPIYRSRDARRRKNSARIAAASAVYIGGGVTDRLLETLRSTGAQDALEAKLDTGGAVVAIAAAAQSLGEVGRSLFGSGKIAGFGWLTGGVVEPNFDPSHDRRLRRLLEYPTARWGLGLPPGSAVLLGPEEKTRIVGKVFFLKEPEGELEIFEESGEASPEEFPK